MSDQQQQINDAPPSGAIFSQVDEEMLLGTMRDFALEGIRPAIGWSKLKEKAQHAVNNAVEQSCRQAIRGAAPIIAGRGFGTIVTTVGDINTKGELVIAKLSAERTRENILGLAEAGRCILVLVAPEVFMGAKPAAVMKDQPDLMDKPAETPEQREAREQAESEARAAKFKQLEPGPAEEVLPDAIGGIQTETVGQLGGMLPEKIKAAADRGVAHRQDGGARKIPADLEGKPNEVAAWLGGWDVVDAKLGGRAADVSTVEVSGGTAKPKRRGRRSTEERLAERARETESA